MTTAEENLDVDIVDKSKRLLNQVNDSNVVQQSKFFLSSACLPDCCGLSMSDEMHTLINAMHNDELPGVVRKDDLLVLFGETLLRKYGPIRKNDIAQRLRQLSRLLVKCRESLSNSSLSYNDVLCGKKFDACVEATDGVCGLNITDDGRREFKLPSLALRLGHLLRKLVGVKQGFCLRNDDLDGLKDAETFGKLLEAEWTDSVATIANITLKRRKDQSIQLLQVTEDLRTLREHQMKEMRLAIDSLQVTPSFSTWRKLAQLTMTRMTVFNKRRGGAVSKLLLKTYETRPDWKNQTNQEVLETLQPMEKMLLKRVDLVQIPGEKSRKVPMLITDDVKKGIEVLNAHRETVGIPSTNPFCFASRSASGHLDSWQAMNLISQEASLTHPELMTSTKLRKYNATVSQLFDLNPGELEWLSNHMGHDLNIHKDFYRLHNSTIEIAKVSRLLMAIDSGNAAKFVGKRLEDITLDEFPRDKEDEMGGNDEDKEAVSVVFARTCTASSDSKKKGQKSSHEGNKTGTRIKRKLASRVLLSDSESEETSQSKTGPRKRKLASRVLLSDSESEETSQSKTGPRKRKLASRVLLSDSESEETSQSKTGPRKRKLASRVLLSDSESEETSQKLSHEESKTRPRKRKLANHDSDSEYSETKLNREEMKTCRPKKRKIGRHLSDSKDKGTKLTKTGWSSAEIQVLKACFGHLLQKGTYPSGKQIQISINQNDHLKNKTTLNVRSKLQHLMRQR
ncbi:uncharacterized protein [Littorina saxatilis]|uniref:uncharacterized protein n=1 Tax=Littorina saxatilis TaxID=31220 RepID=UPI0038B5F029